MDRRRIHGIWKELPVDRLEEERAPLPLRSSPIELGGDVGGSIRTPAAFCGIYGHKPTWGLIPKTGPHLELRERFLFVDHFQTHARHVAMIRGYFGGPRDLAMILDVSSSSSSIENITFGISSRCLGR